MNKGGEYGFAVVDECGMQILKREPEAKLLLCAPQGYSADLLASALVETAAVTAVDMLRIADPRHPFVQMKEVSPC